jgi:hypothetical protein
MPFFTGSGITAEQKQRNAKGRDGLTGLRAPSKFARPDWDKIFDEFALKYANRKVGVFFCGPAVLSKALYVACNKHSKLGGTVFRFHKEN